MVDNARPTVQLATLRSRCVTATLLPVLLSPSLLPAQTPKPAGVTVAAPNPSSTDVARRLFVLSPAASTHTGQRYPVLYLHDAQNLFDPKQSYTGATWQITEAMQRLRETVGFEAIVVGIEHGGPRRVVELMPWPIENFVGDVPPAEGAAYLRGDDRLVSGRAAHALRGACAARGVLQGGDSLAQLLGK